jgi:hypothetical protein
VREERGEDDEAPDRPRFFSSGALDGMHGVEDGRDADRTEPADEPRVLLEVVLQVTLAIVSHNL